MDQFNTKFLDLTVLVLFLYYLLGNKPAFLNKVCFRKVVSFKAHTKQVNYAHYAKYATAALLTPDYISNLMTAFQIENTNYSSNRLLQSFYSVYSDFFKLTQ